MIEWLKQPWPWYISGPLLGLMVPILLFLSNKHFSVSSSFRHMCAAIFRFKAEYFRYDWKKNVWNIVLVIGVIIGALTAVLLLDGNSAPGVSDAAEEMFHAWGIEEPSQLQPPEIFGIRNLLSAQNILLLTGGGFLVGFGTRYANGCTSGHGIMGLSLLNLGSLVAVIGFFIGGVPVSRFLVPFILSRLG